MTNADEVRQFLAERVRAVARLRPDAVDATTPLYRFGVDSRTLMIIVEETERRFVLEADIERISPAETIEALLAALHPAAGNGH